MSSSADRIVRNVRLAAAVLVAGAAVLLAPAGASAAEPVLEYVVPGAGGQVTFTTEGGPVNAEMVGFETLVRCAASRGEGEIIGPRATVSHYTFIGCHAENGLNQPVACKSAGANAEEIKTGPIDAQLVYVDQAKHEVGNVLNPGGGVYLSFECGGETAEARGAFVSSIDPINEQATSATAALTESGSVQVPDEYEGAGGEMLRAVPEGSRDGMPFVDTGVDMTVAVHTSEPVEIRAETSEQVEARQQQEEAQRKHLEELERQEEAANKRHQEEAAASKRREEEAIAQAAAIAQKQEEAATAAGGKRRQEEQSRLTARPLTRAQLLAKALKVCRRDRSRRRRTRCERAARRKYGGKRPQERRGT